MSTTDAIEDVLRMAYSTKRGPVQDRNLCVLISLNVKNAFNSAPWTLIDEALRRAAVPEYMIKVLWSYMYVRSLLVDDDLCMPVTWLEKSECVVLTNKNSFREPRIFIHECQVPVRRSLKYLGVRLDIWLSFVEYVSAVSAREKKAVAALARLMPTSEARLN
jgi:hypothetical protein